MKTKKNSLFTIGLLALSLNIFSCSGDDGAIGSDGEKGIQGEVGSAGADGSILYRGEGDPLATTGIKDDYYFDVTTGLLYGPKKENNKWDGADSFSLNGQDGNNGTNGADGQDGTNGSKILSGEGDPVIADGKTGDFYLNTTSFTLYGPKTDNAWSIGLMLKGADGNANVRTFILTVESSDWTEYDNTQGTNTKKIHYFADLPALNQDVVENGFVLVYYTIRNLQHPLPYASLKSNGNFYKAEYLTVFKDGKYLLWLKEELVAPLGTGNTNDVLLVQRKVYRIKIITGKVAEQLNLNKDNLPVYNKLIENLITY
jgi:hypothetical protein